MQLVRHLIFLELGPILSIIVPTRWMGSVPSVKKAINLMKLMNVNNCLRDVKFSVLVTNVWNAFGIFNLWMVPAMILDVQTKGSTIASNVWLASLKHYMGSVSISIVSHTDLDIAQHA